MIVMYWLTRVTGMSSEDILTLAILAFFAVATIVIGLFLAFAPVME